MSADGAGPRVAVLLATYNGVRWLDDQLASLHSQTGVRLHVFARDDGSSDGTPALLADWATRRPEFLTVLAAATPSGSAARNFFALLGETDLAGFDHVALADQDDVWMPDKLSRATAMMREAGAEGYSSDLLAFDVEAGETWMVRKAGRDAALDYLFQGASAGCTYVLSVRAAALVAQVLSRLTLPIFAGVSHDWTIYAICRSRGLAWIRDSGSRVIYRQHNNNVYGARSGLAGLRQRLRMVGDRWYRDHILWLRQVVVGSAAEAHILDAIRRGGWADRIDLARRAVHFRRSPRDVLLLRGALLGGRL